MRDRLRQLLSQNAGKGAGISARQVNGATEILVYDVIDPWFGISAKAFADAVSAAGDGPLTVRVNSPGGDVFEGRAMANAIRNHKGASLIVVDGLAASAATHLVMAGDRAEMARGSFLMVHEAWCFCIDNKRGLRKTANLLEKVDGEIAADYVGKAGVSAEQAEAWMEAETWFTAEEAVTAKLADAMAEADADVKGFNLAAFERPPQALLDSIAALAANDAGPTQAQLRAAAERRLRLYDPRVA